MLTLVELLPLMYSAEPVAVFFTLAFDEADNVAVLAVCARVMVFDTLSVRDAVPLCETEMEPEVRLVPAHDME